jgi:hypothetical protein
LATAAARVALFVAAILGLALGGWFLDGELARALGWGQGRDEIAHLAWTIGTCLCAGAATLRLLGGHSSELLCAWALTELWITCGVAAERSWGGSLFWDLWLVLSLPLSLWIPGIAAAYPIRALFV